MSDSKLLELKTKVSQLAGKKQVMEQSLADAAKEAQEAVEIVKAIGVSSVEQAKVKKQELINQRDQLMADVENQLTLLEGKSNA